MERRRLIRRRAFQAGSVSSRHLDGAPCVVRDLSDDGALLLVDEPQRLPSALTLTLARGGRTERARVVWRGDRVVGIAFERAGVPGADPAAAPPNVISLDAVRRAKRADPGARALADRIARAIQSRPSPGGSGAD